MFEQGTTTPILNSCVFLKEVLCQFAKLGDDIHFRKCQGNPSEEFVFELI